MVTNKTITGTKEWASTNRNCLLGCPHRCRYCYARDFALWFKRIESYDDWGEDYLELKQDEVDKGRGKAHGVIMFPSSHDIVPEFLDPCMTLLGKLLKAGNDVLVVSKPHPDCVTAMCDEFGDHRDKILFRFTISAMDDDLLAFWEPGAPRFTERLASLRHAHGDGFRTSVSVEPMLDTANVVTLYEALIPHISDSIWFGKMRNGRKLMRPSTPEDEAALERVEQGQTDDRIRQIYKSLKRRRKVRWKDSIKRVLGLPLATEAGQDA